IYRPQLQRTPAPPNGVSTRLELGPVPPPPPIRYRPDAGPLDEATRMIRKDLPAPMPRTGPHFGVAGEKPEPPLREGHVTSETLAWRAHVWSMLHAQNDILFGFLNGAAGQIMRFHNAEKDPQLAELHGITPGKGEVEALANAQRVPKGAKSTVESVFKNGEGPAGTQANTAGLDDNLATARNDAGGRGGRRSLKQAEAGVEAGLEKVKTAQLGLSAAGHRLASSSYGVTMEEADEKKEAATKKKEALEAKAKQIKGYVDKVIEVG